MVNVKIEVSARHVHLTQNDLEKLFGEGYKLKIEKELSQPGQFICRESVDVIGAKGKIANVKIWGPCRSYTQIEVTKSDSLFLGSPAPFRLSGKIIGSGAIKLVGPAGELELKEGLIVAKRHIHLNVTQAQKLGVVNSQKVKVAIEGPRALIFDEVEIRINDEFEKEMHIDLDEAGAAGIAGEGEGYII